MTRLKAEDMADTHDWTRYERQLAACTGESLFSLAARTVGLDQEAARTAVQGVRVAVVPVSSGEGLIAGFATSLAQIATHLGFTATVMPPDAAGFTQARAQGHDLLLWADDDTYLAENLHTGFQAENGQATGAGFANALLCLWHIVSGLPDPAEAVVLGCGPVGVSGARTLLRHGASVTLCDLDSNKARQVARQLYAETGRMPDWCTAAELAQDLPTICAPETCAPETCAPETCAPATCTTRACPTGGKGAEGKSPLSRIACLLDAAPTNACFPLSRLLPEACIAAPCVPCSWPTTFHLWHDPLQLGTAVMLLAATFEQRLGPFHNENALLTQAWQPPQRGVDSGENDVFPQNDALKHRVFQKQNALGPFSTQTT